MLVATSQLEMERMRALWDRTAANGLEREWLNAGELREREPKYYRARRDLCPFQRHCQLPRRDGGNGENFSNQKAETIIYNAEVSALKEHKNGVVVRTRQGANTRRPR